MELHESIRNAYERITDLGYSADNTGKSQSEVLEHMAAWLCKNHGFIVTPYRADGSDPIWWDYEIWKNAEVVFSPEREDDPFWSELEMQSHSVNKTLDLIYEQRETAKQ
jgi:hypothetical protein